MNQPTLETKRILVVLDTSSRGLSALQAAVKLATITRAELQGLYVEDEDLVRLASLPFAREVDFLSALPRPLQLANMERELRSAAERTQQAFANAVQQVNLAWTFRVVRGAVTRSSLAAGGDADLLVIGQQGCSCRTVAGQYLRPSSRAHRVVAVYDGSSAAFRVVEFADRLAKANSAGLTVLVLPGDDDNRSQHCVAWLQQHGIRAEVNRALSSSDEGVIKYVRRLPPQALLINRDSELINGSLISRIINESECPLILC